MLIICMLKYQRIKCPDVCNFDSLKAIKEKDGLIDESRDRWTDM